MSCFFKSESSGFIVFEIFLYAFFLVIMFLINCFLFLINLIKKRLNDKLRKVIFNIDIIIICVKLVLLYIVVFKILNFKIISNYKNVISLRIKNIIN